MVQRAVGCGTGFVDRHRLFDLAASDFDTRSSCLLTLQVAPGFFPPCASPAGFGDSPSTRR
jgi:hypothetical protein